MCNFWFLLRLLCVYGNHQMMSSIVVVIGAVVNVNDGFGDYANDCYDDLVGFDVSLYLLLSYAMLYYIEVK